MIDIAHVNCSPDESVIFNDKIWTIQTTNISKQVISESMIVTASQFLQRQ